MPVSERPPQRPSLTRLRGRCLHTERVRGTGFGESVLRRGTGAEVGCQRAALFPGGQVKGQPGSQAAAPRVSELRFRIPLCSRELGGSAVLIVLPLLFLDCDSACVGCTGKGPGQCKDCIPGYSKESGQCAGQCRASAGGWDLPAGTTA